MQLSRLFAAAAVGLGLCSVGYAAGPQMPSAQPSAADGNGIIQVQRRDCHADVDEHYLRQFGQPVLHYHDNRCRVVVVERRRRDDHWDHERYRNHRHDDNCVYFGVPGVTGFKFCD